jgi:hypothetical protein
VIGQRSIRTKLLTVVMSTTLAALVVSVGTVIGYDLRSYHRALQADLSTQAELLGHMTAAALTFDDVRLARENLSLMRTRPLVRAGAIYDASGALFASYVAPGVSGAFPGRPGAAGLARVQGDDLVLYQNIIEDGELLGTVYLRAEYRLLARTVDYLMIAANVLLLAMAIAWLLTRRLGHLVTAPIIAITETARDVVATRLFAPRAAHQRRRSGGPGGLVQRDAHRDRAAHPGAGKLEPRDRARSRAARRSAAGSDAPERPARAPGAGAHGAAAAGQRRPGPGDRGGA